MDDVTKATAKIIATAWADSTDAFQNALMAIGDREKLEHFLKERGMELPEFADFADDGKIQFVANTDKVRYIVIPERPKFTDEDMGLIIKLRQICATDCSCTHFSGGSSQHILDTIHKIFGGD